MGIVDIGFPSIDKGDIIKGIFAFLTTIASLTIAILAYNAASKSAIAAEKAVKVSEISAIAAQRSLFNATFERRLIIYKAMWELNSILEEVDRKQGVSMINPKNNFVSIELINRLKNLHETLIYDTLLLPEIIQKIKSFKEKNHQRNREISKILQDMKQYVKAP